MECVLQLQLQAWTVLWEMRYPFPHGASQQWVQISQGKVKNPESLAVLRPHHSHLCHMGQCQPHCKTPAQASVGGLGYVCLQAAVLQPPPCVAPGTKPEQAQVDRNRFACHANKTRSCMGPALQLGVCWQILYDALSSYRTSGTGGLTLPICVLQDGLKHCTWLTLWIPRDLVHPSLMQKEFDINSFSLLIYTQVGSVGGMHLKTCTGARHKTALLPTR